jgi:RNA 2',3'-cyclic 3'-phosphodiesterase
MSETLRAFFAVDIRCPAALRRVLTDLSGMGRAVKAVDPDQLHVTLKFLGATSAELLPGLTAILEAAARGEGAFDVALSGLGAFPGAHRPSVVWAALDRADPLQRLAATLEAAVEPLGFARESRPFTPHVTLARIKARPPAKLAEILRDGSESTFGEARIENVVLYRSDTTTHGPRYTPLARVLLPAS